MKNVDARLSVLLVDDDDMVLKTIGRALRNRWVVGIANSVSQALIESNSKTYDVVLSDWDLPDGNALDVINKIQLPVVIHTGSELCDLQSEAFEYCVLIKGCSLCEIERALLFAIV
jgi:DNA-binding response OmpR family regulator